MATRKTGAARWWTEVELQGPTRIQTDTVSVVAAPTQIVNQSPDRVNLVITNNGNFNISVTPFPNSVLTTGIVLGSGGGNVTMNVRDDFELVSQAWWGVSVGGATLTTAFETIADILMPPEQA